MIQCFGWVHEMGAAAQGSTGHPQHLYINKVHVSSLPLCPFMLAMDNGSFAAIFPHEISGYIFSLLSQKDRIQCIHVCKVWRQGAIYWCDQAWRTTQLRLFDIDSMIDWLIDVSPIIHDLHIDSKLDPSFDAADTQEAVHGDTDIEDSMRDQQHIPAAQKIPTHLSKLLSIRFDQLESIRKWHTHF